jgi:predicted transcriptional regulator
MAKRKITVTIDEDLVERAHQLGEDTSLSAVMNEALAAHVERLSRLAALQDLLDSWERRFGPVGEHARAEAGAAFDELDGLADGPSALRTPAATAKA